MPTISYSCAMHKCMAALRPGIYVQQFTIGRTSCKPLLQTRPLQRGLPQPARKTRNQR